MNLGGLEQNRCGGPAWCRISESPLASGALPALRAPPAPVLCRAMTDAQSPPALGGERSDDDVNSSTMMTEAGAAVRRGAERAGTAAAAGVRHLALFVSQGPATLAFVCVVGGLATGATAVLRIGNLVGEKELSPMGYLINGYQLLFGLMIVFLEAEPERMRRSCLCKHCAGCCTCCRGRVLDNCKFATALLGRGLFYVFIGSFGVIQGTVSSITVGLWMIMCGVLLLMVRCSCTTWQPPPEEEA